MTEKTILGLKARRKSRVTKTEAKHRRHMIRWARDKNEQAEYERAVGNDHGAPSGEIPAHLRPKPMGSSLPMGGPRINKDR